jgi:ABC-type sugar transport system substrate-binding protein
LPALLVLLGALALTACGGSSGGDSTAATSSPSGSGGSSHSIAYFSPLESNSYAQGFTEGVKAAGAKLGVEVTVFDANGDSGQQASQIQTATSSGDYDGFLITPITPAAIPAITKAKSAGIVSACGFLICGSDPTSAENADPDVVVSQLAVSIPEQMTILAEVVSKACEGTDPCEVVYVPGTLVDPRTSARIEDLEKELKKYPEVVLKSTEQAGEDNVAKAQDAVGNLLAAYPNLDVIACSGDQCAQGAETALQKAGKLGTVKLIGEAGSKIGAERVAAGKWFADSCPELVTTFGEEMTEVLVEALEGKKVPATVPAKCKPPYLTKENAAEFEAQWSGH